MRRTLQTMAVVSALAAGFAIASPLLAAETQSPTETSKTPNMMGGDSRMMDSGSGMMGMMTQMSQMMETCNKMMQTAMNGDHGASKPNAPPMQKDAPATPGK